METQTDRSIGKNSLTVAELAIAYPRALAIFTKYNIDYCCGGDRSIDEACRRVGLEPEKIMTEIEQHIPLESAEAVRPENWSSKFLADFIVENHHRYVRSAIPEISTFLEKVCKAHGSDCIELIQIRECFEDLAEELLSHMQKEELILFPAIKRLESQFHLDHPLFVMIQAPMASMEHDHQLAGSIIKEIRTLSKDYTPPDFACPTFKMTYKKVSEFENDLMKHIHLENNILFKRMKNNLPETPICSL